MSAPWIALVTVLWAVVLVLGLLVIGLMRRVVPILERVERHADGQVSATDLGGLPAGTMVPDVVVVLDGAEVRLRSVFDEACLVVFVDPDCVACGNLTMQLARHGWPSDVVRLVLVVDQAFSASYREQERAGVTVLRQAHGQMSAAFHQRVFPQAFSVDEAGIVTGQSVPGSLEELRSLAQSLGLTTRTDTEMLSGS